MLDFAELTCVYCKIDINGKDLQRYEARAKIAKALAHPSRLMLVDLCQHQEVCVNDLSEAVGADQSTVSRHLSILKDAPETQLQSHGTRSFSDLVGQVFAAAVEFPSRLAV